MDSLFDALQSDTTDGKTHIPIYSENEVEHLLNGSGFAVVEKKMSRLVYTDNDFVCYLCGPL
ncbi:hypothetical protein [Geoglobus acetivorans]|uniref:Uncharacterized protein n=1 Tax=Geoglobus acetivorans TaxID=565033 RepID=A0ABZ3H0E0_GEOAI|nr:hypothetical protein [Geoglobus acetivorans]